MWFRCLGVCCAQSCIEFVVSMKTVLLYWLNNERERVLMDTVENAENQVNEETDIEIFDITLLDFLDDLI